jgi:hypothetical protein
MVVYLVREREWFIKVPVNLIEKVRGRWRPAMGDNLN